MLSKEAVKLRDEGKLDEARNKLQEGARYLGSNAQQYQDPKLDSLSNEFRKDAEELEKDQEWGRNRKNMVDRQYKIERQQKF